MHKLLFCFLLTFETPYSFHWYGVGCCNLQTELCYFKGSRYRVFIKRSLMKFQGYSQNWKKFFPSMTCALTTADFLTCENASDHIYEHLVPIALHAFLLINLAWQLFRLQPQCPTLYSKSYWCNDSADLCSKTISPSPYIGSGKAKVERVIHFSHLGSLSCPENVLPGCSKYGS